MVGETLGNYRIVGKIGEGGMGAVYRAEHALIGRRVAVKVLLPELSSRADVVRRFFNEARAIANLNHPAIIDVFDFGFHSDGRGFIVMELLEGESLGVRLKRVRRLDPAFAVALTRQIAGAMAVAHSHGVIHRDLKPDNLFLVRDRTGAPGEVIKILDFGVAKLASGDSADEPGVTKTGAVLGTPLYMAPEQCRGAGQVDERADIYALGCVLYHLLSGQPPFVYQFSGELIAAHLHEIPRAPRSFDAAITPALEEVVLRMLAKRPEERQQSMPEVLGDLDRATNAAPAAVGRRTLSLDGGATQVAREPPPSGAGHTMILPETPSRATEPSSPVVGEARVNRSASDTTLERNTGEISSAPWRWPRRYWIAGAAVMASAGLGLVALTGQPATRLSVEKTERVTEAAAPAEPAPVAPASAEPPSVAAAPVAPEPVAPEPVAPAPTPTVLAAAPEPIRVDSPPAVAGPAYVTFKVEGAREEITVKVDGKGVPAGAPIRLPRDGAVHSVRVTSVHFLPETFSRRADSDRILRLKNELRLLTAPGN